MSGLTIGEDASLWTPNKGGQLGFMDDFEHRYCALAGGWYGGKTWAGARKLANLHVCNAFDHDGKPTGFNSLVVAQTYSLATSINIPELRKAFDEMGLAYRFVADQKKFWFELPDLGTHEHPSLIYVRSADRADKITGFSVASVWGDEVARWKIDELNPLNDPLIQTDGRLRRPGGAQAPAVLQFNMTFTHEGDGTKVYRDFIEIPKPDHALYTADTYQNPHAKEFADAIVTQLDPELAKQYIEGGAISLRGLNVYRSFSSENIEDSLTLVDHLPLQLGLDFNSRPGMHGEMGQEFLKDDLYTNTHEFYEAGLTIPRLFWQLGEFIKAEGGKDGFKWPRLELFGDASGSNRLPGHAETNWDFVIQAVQDLAKVWGFKWILRVETANPFVEDRVNTMNAALCDLRGARHFKVHPRCLRLVNDLRTMRRDDKGLIDKRDQFISHASDCSGYRMWTLRPIRKQVRTMETIHV